MVPPVSVNASCSIGDNSDPDSNTREVSHSRPKKQRSPMNSTDAGAEEEIRSKDGHSAG
jgi:hypothetical protein